MRRPYKSVLNMYWTHTFIKHSLASEQKGARHKHSNYITRRLQDMAEASHENIIFTFLDWEKAFDKVDQQRMIQALARLNPPPKMLRVLQSLYQAPKFRAKFNEETSEFKTQDSGIRQTHWSQTCCLQMVYPFSTRQ